MSLSLTTPFFFPFDCLQMLNICAKAALAREEDALKCSFDVLSDMLACGLQPTVVSFNTLMNVVAKSPSSPDSKALGRAHAVLEMMNDAGVKPNTVTFTAMLDAVSRWVLHLPQLCFAFSRGTLFPQSWCISRQLGSRHADVQVDTAQMLHPAQELTAALHYPPQVRGGQRGEGRVHSRVAAGDGGPEPHAVGRRASKRKDLQCFDQDVRAGGQDEEVSSGLLQRLECTCLEGTISYVDTSHWIGAWIRYCRSPLYLYFGTLNHDIE